MVLMIRTQGDKTSFYIIKKCEGPTPSNKNSARQKISSTDKKTAATRKRIDQIKNKISNN
jgi:hypothetical protein